MPASPKLRCVLGIGLEASYPYSMLILLWKLKLYRYSIRLLQLPKRFAHYVGCMSFKIKILAKYFSWVVPHVNLFSFHALYIQRSNKLLGALYDFFVLDDWLMRIVLIHIRRSSWDFLRVSLQLSLGTQPNTVSSFFFKWVFASY